MRHGAARGRLPLAAAVVAALAVACGTETLDSNRVERVIKEGIEKQSGPGTIEVECPDDIEKRPGMRFTCTARTKGAEAPVEVVQGNDEGNIRWEIRPKSS